MQRDVAVDEWVSDTVRLCLTESFVALDVLLSGPGELARLQAFTGRLGKA